MPGFPFDFSADFRRSPDVRRLAYDASKRREIVSAAVVTTGDKKWTLEGFLKTLEMSFGSACSPYVLWL